MLKTTKVISLAIVLILCVILGGCQDNKKYLSDTKQTFDLIKENTSLCYELLEQYSVIAETSVFKYAANNFSKEKFEDWFFKVYVSIYGENTDKFNKLESKSLEERMAKLRNPPRKYENTYNKMLELYGAYTKIQRVAVNKRGSELQGGFRNINQTMDEIITLKKQLEVMVGDKK